MKQILPLLFLLYAVTAYGQNIPARPNPPRLVNDFAHVLTADQTEALEQKLVNYDDSTSTQIVIVTVPSTGDYDIHEYALKLLREWGVGNKKTNNGIVILAAINDRKVRIETGYGMEGAIPDITANQIIDNSIKPNFKAGGTDNFYRGFDQATNDIIKAAAGEYKAPEAYTRRTSRGGAGLPSIIFIIILILIISRIGGGGRGGGMVSRRGYNPFLGGLLGGIIGGNIGRGGGSGWSDGGGGGGWSGGGGGGGGFGGFGGGSGGGGGASGSW